MYTIRVLDNILQAAARGKLELWLDCQRVGDYLVILDIRRGECVVVALDVDHRSNVSDDPAVA
jgi:hypothetical protein